MFNKNNDYLNRDTQFIHNCDGDYNYESGENIINIIKESIRNDFYHSLEVVDFVICNGTVNCTVFVSDHEGMGIANKNVLLQYGDCSVNATTDNDGYAHFIDIISNGKLFFKIVLFDNHSDILQWGSCPPLFISR